VGIATVAAGIGHAVTLKQDLHVSHLSFPAGMDKTSRYGTYSNGNYFTMEP
jgi:hypothetical protein